VTFNAFAARPFPVGGTAGQVPIKNSDLEGDVSWGDVGAGSHPDLAAHDALGLATDAELAAHDHDADYEASGAVATHAGLADPHTGYVREADANWIDLTDSGETSLHSHAGGPGGEAFPVGSVFLAVVATSPATLLGYGTWSAFGAGRMLVGLDSGDAAFDTVEEVGGAATHTHAGHSAHAFTQPAAHSDHAVQSHSAHAGATVDDHTDVTNHVHVENRNSAQTGGLSGWAAGDTSTNTSTATGYSTANPTGIGVAAMVHTVGQASAHSDHAAVSHSAHSGGAVDAHSAHDTPTSLPPYIVVHMWKRTA